MARSNWNPNYPSAVGIEFQGVGTRSSPILSGGTAFRVLRFVAQQSGPLNMVALYIGPNSNVPLLDTAKFGNHRYPFIVELMPVTSLDAGIEIFSTYPSIITTFTNLRRTDGNPVQNTDLQFADSASLEPAAGGSASATCYFPGAAPFSSSRQPLQVILQSGVDHQAKLVRTGDLNNPSATTPRWSQVTPAGAAATRVGELWIELNAESTWHQLSPQILREFGNPADSRRWQINRLAVTNSQVWSYLQMRVDHIAERRLGRGIIEIPPTDGTFTPLSNTWINVPLTAPNATGAPTITAGVEYALVIRPPYGNSDYGVSASLDVRSLADARIDNAPIHYSSLAWDLSQPDIYFGSDIVTPKATGTQQDGLLSLRSISSGAQTTDTQPYETTLGIVVATFLFAEQTTITVDTTQEYRSCRALLSTADAPNENLIFEIRNTSGGTLIHTQEVTVEDVETNGTIIGTDDLGNDYRAFNIDFGMGITLPASVSVRFLSHADAVNHPWFVSALASSYPITGSVPVTGSPVTGAPYTGDQTYVSGSGTSHATGFAYDPRTQAVIDVTAYGKCDIQFTLFTQPSEVTNVTVTEQAQLVEGGTCEVCLNTNSCGATGIPYAEVCWDASSLPVTGFVQYEVQRSEDGGDFETVAYHTNPLNTCYDDYELPYGMNVCYRVRQLRSDGAASDWSAPVCITIAAETVRGFTIITAPENPLLNVAYPEDHGSSLPSQSDWTILDGQDTSYAPVYGRDNQLAFRPVELRGMQFSRTMILSALCTADTPRCLDVAQPLRNLMTEPLSYVVVRDDCGGRWYSSIIVPTITRLADPSLPGDIWLADVQVTEITRPSAIVDDTLATALVLYGDGPPTIDDLQIFGMNGILYYDQVHGDIYEWSGGPEAPPEFTRGGFGPPPDPSLFRSWLDFTTGNLYEQE